MYLRKYCIPCLCLPVTRNVLSVQVYPGMLPAEVMLLLSTPCLSADTHYYEALVLLESNGNETMEMM